VRLRGVGSAHPASPGRYALHWRPGWRRAWAHLLTGLRMARQARLLKLLLLLRWHLIARHALGLAMGRRTHRCALVHDDSVLVLLPRRPMRRALLILRMLVLHVRLCRRHALPVHSA
jgi:hypothetical protein